MKNVLTCDCGSTEFTYQNEGEFKCKGGHKLQIRRYSMRVKVVLSIGDKLVKGNVLECVETYRYTNMDGNEEGYDVVVVEGDEIIIDIRGEQYAPLTIEDGVVTAWSPQI